MIFRSTLEFLQNHRGDFGRRIDLAVGLDTGRIAISAYDLVGNGFDLIRDFIKTPPHETFDGKYSIFRVGNRLTFGNLAGQTLTAAVDGNDRRRRSIALLIGDNGGLAAFHDGDHRVRGS